MDQSLTDDATRRLRGADGKFIAANERVIMYDHTAGDLSVDPSRSSSVGNPSEGDDGNLQTRYRQKPMLASVQCHRMYHFQRCDNTGALLWLYQQAAQSRH